MDMASKCSRGPAGSLGACASGAHRKSDAVPPRPRVSVPDTCALLARGKGLRAGSSAVRSPLSRQLADCALSSSSSVRAVVVEEAPAKVEQRHELEAEATLSALFLRDSDLSNLSLSRLVLSAQTDTRPFDASHQRTGSTGLEEPAGSSPHVLLAQRQHKGERDGKGTSGAAGDLPGAASRVDEGRLPVEVANGSSPELPGCSPAVQQHALGAVLQSRPPPVTEKKEGLGGDYHVNVGYAIRTLREELPTLFYKEMSYDIFRDDITFQDPLNTFRGLKSYQTIFWALRFHGRIFFKALWVDVNRVWQPNERTITIRWSVRGVPRVPWEAWGRFDGTSEYKLDSNGKIYAHKVDNVAFSDPPVYRPLTVMELLNLAGVRSQTPGITCFCARACQRVVGWFGRAEPPPPRPSLACVLASSAAIVTEGSGSAPVGGVCQEASGLGLERGGAGVLRGEELGLVTWFRFYLATAATLALQDDLSFAARALLLVT